MRNKSVTKTQIGNTLFIVTSECSPTATETIEDKLERLIGRHLSDSKSYPLEREKQLDVYSDQSQYGMNTI